MFLNVRDMELRPLRFSEEFPAGKLDLLDGKLRQTSPLTIEGQAELNPVLEEIRLTGRLRVAVEADCDRCLELVKYPIDTGFDLLYLPESEEALPGETGLNDEDAEVAFYKGAGLELDDVAQEQMLLALPMQRLCREDCAGLCPVCGENWNHSRCNCPGADPDDRWAALRAIKLEKS
jgi:uncharacterized protein